MPNKPRFLKWLWLACAAHFAAAEEPVGERPRPPSQAPSREAASKEVGVVAVVGDDVITRADLDRALRQWVSQLRRDFPSAVVEREIPRLEWMLLERMIGDKAILQEVKKEEAKNDGRPFVSEEELDFFIQRQFENRREKNPTIRTIDDWYDAVSKEEGLSRKEYRDFLKMRIAIDRYIRKYVLRSVDSDVSPEEARAYYREHLDEFTVPKEISFRQISLRQMDQALSVKEAIDKGLREGIPFAELAAKYSEDADPASAGRIWKKSFEDIQAWHRPIPDVLRRLEKGQVSEPVYTERGVFIFYVEDVVPGEPKSFSEVQESIRRKLSARREDIATRAAVKKLLERTHVVRFLERPPGVPPEDLDEAP